MQVLVTVKAYPEVSQKLGEVVCVAGIRVDTGHPEWVRLWPIDFRGQDVLGRFTKYQVIEVEARKSRKDPRPESFQPNVDSIVGGATLGPEREWAARRPYVEPLIGESMCAIQRQQEADGTSLGAFRPAEVVELTIDDAEPWSEGKMNRLGQLNLLEADRRELEWIPYTFRYRYRCSDPDCNGHHQSIIDWEIKQAYRQWLRQYPDDWRDRIRDRWLGQLCADDRDTVFFVGNQFGAPKAFLVLGVWWPPKQPATQLGLLDRGDDQG